MTMRTPTLHHAFDVDVELGPLEDHGETRVGHRRVIPIVGGTITGVITADILAGGADWQILRADGAVDIDGRYSARTPEGDLLLLHATGVRSGPPDVLEALLRGEQVAADAYYFRTVVTIETSAARLAHLQNSLYVAVAERSANSVRYSAFRLD
jgi:hypothetical protein